MRNCIKKVACFIAIMLLAIRVLADGGVVVWWEIPMDHEGITVYDRDGEEMEFDFDQPMPNAARFAYRTSEDSDWDYLPIHAYDDMEGSYQIFGKVVPQPGAFFSGIDNWSAYQFAIEIGNFIDGEWVHTELQSAVVTYDYLESNGHIAAWIDSMPEYVQPWTPGVYHSVPEPSSGLLVLIGSSLLALRRRRINI